MPRTTTSKKDDLPESPQAEGGTLGSSVADPQSGQEAQEKGPQTITGADMRAAFNRLRERANRGDRQAQAALVKYLDAHPELWGVFGDPARHAEMSLVESIANGEWLTTQAIPRRAAEMRRQLSRPSASPLEKLAVQRLVACWLHLQHVESMCARADGKLEGAKLWLQRQQQAHKLYAAAEKSLLLIQGQMPLPVQPTAVDKVEVSKSLPEANGAEPKEESSEPAGTVSGAFSEDPVAEFNGVNRIAHLMGALSQAPHSAEEDTSDGNRRINGHGTGGQIMHISP